MLLRPCHESHATKALSWKPCYQDLVIEAMLLSPYDWNHVTEAMPLKSRYCGHVSEAMLLWPRHWVDLRQLQHEFAKSLFWIWPYIITGLADICIDWIADFFATLVVDETATILMEPMGKSGEYETQYETKYHFFCAHLSAFEQSNHVHKFHGFSLVSQTCSHIRAKIKHIIKR